MYSAEKPLPALNSWLPAASTHIRGVFTAFLSPLLSTFKTPPFQFLRQYTATSISILHMLGLRGGGGRGVRGTQVRDAESQRIEQCILHLACAEGSESG
jgi:hypothetical protein